MRWRLLCWSTSSPPTHMAPQFSTASLSIQLWSRGLHSSIWCVWIWLIGKVGLAPSFCNWRIIFSTKGGADRRTVGDSSDPELQHSNGVGPEGNQVGSFCRYLICHWSSSFCQCNVLKKKIQVRHWSCHGRSTKGTRTYGWYCPGTGGWKSDNYVWWRKKQTWESYFETIGHFINYITSQSADWPTGTGAERQGWAPSPAPATPTEWKLPARTRGETGRPWHVGRRHSASCTWADCWAP